MNLLARFARLKLLVPTLLIVALLVIVLTVSDIPTVLDHISRIPVSTMAVTLGLAFAYLVLKGALFHFLLEWLQIHPGPRPFGAAYAVGEMVITIPGGIYAQNWVLRRDANIDFSYSAAATTAILIVEGGIALLTLAILGIPGSDGLRISIAAFLGLAVLAVVALEKIEPVRSRAARLVQMGPFQRVGRELIQTAIGLRTLLTPRILARSVLLAASYLFTITAGFYMVAHAVGVTALTFGQAITVYFAALSFLGLIEAGGLGVMEAWGYTGSQAIASLLGFRLVWLGATWILCGPLLLALRSELR